MNGLSGLELSFLGVEKDGVRMCSSGENPGDVLVWWFAVRAQQSGCVGSNMESREENIQRTLGDSQYIFVQLLKIINGLFHNGIPHAHYTHGKILRQLSSCDSEG